MTDRYAGEDIYVQDGRDVTIEQAQDVIIEGTVRGDLVIQSAEDVVVSDATDVRVERGQDVVLESGSVEGGRVTVEDAEDAVDGR